MPRSWKIKVVALTEIVGNLTQARNRFMNNYPPRVQGAIQARGLVGEVTPFIFVRPDLGLNVWEIYPVTVITHDALVIEDFLDIYNDMRDFLRSDLEAWLESEGHTVRQVFFKDQGGL